jgi:aminomethyltransferase
VGKERMPVREGAKIVTADGTEIGVVTSGTLGPTVNQPVALAYVATAHAAVGTEVFAIVRDKRTPMVVSSTPFTPNRYYRG